MTRLEKKCFIASASAHGLVALLLALGPMLWVSQRQELTLPVLNFIPSRLVDGAGGGGGSPTAQGMPAPAPPAPAQPLTLAPARLDPVPPAPQPDPPKAQVKPAKTEVETAKPRPAKAADSVPTDKKIIKTEESQTSQETKPKKKIELSFARDTGASKKKTENDARARADSAQRAAQAQFSSRLNTVLGAIGQGASTGTSFEVPGPGGEATANYGQFVELFYRKAWSPPSDLADELATVRVTIVILRNGSVESFKITRRSGAAALDNSVERLRNLKFVAPFPEGATDEKRSFVINFNLQAER